jgi:hypothetical protein
MNNGLDHHWINPIRGALFFPQPLFSTLNTIVIAITWQHVGKTAASYNQASEALGIPTSTCS